MGWAAKASESNLFYHDYISGHVCNMYIFSVSPCILLQASEGGQVFFSAVVHVQCQLLALGHHPTNNAACIDCIPSPGDVGPSGQLIMNHTPKSECYLFYCDEINL